MSPMKTLASLALLAGAIGSEMAAATTPATGSRIAERVLQAGDTEFVVEGDSGEEYTVDIIESGTPEIIITPPEAEPVEFLQDGAEGEITTVMSESGTFDVSYDEDGEVTGVVLVSESTPARRTQQVDFPGRRLQGSCEDQCNAASNQICGVLIFLCALIPDFPLCAGVDFLCDPSGILEGCERTCAVPCTVETEDTDCDTAAGEICCPSLLICEVPLVTGGCGDPHMSGFLGQKFDFTGEDGAWYCLLKDGPSTHVNMRVTSPVPSVPEITYITGLSIITADLEGVRHTIEISVTDPHNLNSACPAGVSPCLAEGALTVKLDGSETLVSPGEVALGTGVAISAVNIPGACRTFGFEKYWELKKLQNAEAGRRRLGVLEFMADMSDWILSDPTATNMAECTEYVATAGESGLFAHDSEHASFQIMTPAVTFRLNHGRLHQLAMRDPTDQFDLPDHLTWQMNVAVDHHAVSMEASGILGETVVPTVDSNGKPIMKGIHAIRGSQEDYRVGGAFETSFAQGQRNQ